MGKLLDFNHQSLTLRFMEAAKVDDLNSKAVDQTLTNSNRELLERWLIQIEKGRGKLVEILLRKLPLPMAERSLLQLENDRDDVVEAALAGGTIERYLDQMEAGNTETVEKILQDWNELGQRFLTQMEKKRVGTINRILALEEALVERFLSQCERFGNRIIDRLIAQTQKEAGRKSMALRLLVCLENDEYELCQRLTTQMEVDDLCYKMGEMILAKKDSGREEFGLKYLIELEKKRSPIVERCFKYEELAKAEESSRLVVQLEQDRTELVEYLLNIFEKDDAEFANRLLSMVETGKYDFVMKICRENLFMTAENAKGDYDKARTLLFATDNFRDQVMNHLYTQQFLANFKTCDSLVNELSKQQDVKEAGACYGFMNTLFHYLEETPEMQLARLTGPGATPVGDVKDEPATVVHNLTALAMAMAINLSRK